MSIWAFITGEYPPQPGGVADYTRLVARGLAAAGDEVHVFASAYDGTTAEEPGVRLHRLPDLFGPRSLLALDRHLARLPGPVQVVVQYTPHAFGMKAMNLPLCLWLAARRRRRYWVMFHEVAFPFRRGQPPRHTLLAGVTRVMAAVLARSAARVFVSIEQWEPLLRRLAPSLPPCHWLPVPSNLDARPDPGRCRELRGRLTPGPNAALVGHFGTYEPSIASMVAGVLPPLLARDRGRVGLLVGRNGPGFADRLTRDHPDLVGRLVATGGLPSGEASEHLAVCDLLLQPYPDGACSRRGSLMAGLALGRPIVTTVGRLTDSVFLDTDAVLFVPDDGLAGMVPAAEALLGAPEERALLGRRAASFYESHFSPEIVVREMRRLLTS